MSSVYPPFTEDYRFTGPSTAISCTVEYDQEQESYVATSSAGFKAASTFSAEDAALACFQAWVTARLAWFEPPRDE